MAAFFWWLLPFVLAALFAFTDTWYFIRLFLLGLRIKLKSRSKESTGEKKHRSLKTLLEPYEINGIVLPSDLDFLLHMNNSKYLREMDFGRLGYSMETGINGALRANNGSMLLAAHSIRYRRSLTLFQRFLLCTKVLCWDENALYFEQRMVRSSDGFVCAINLAKIAIRGTTVSDILKTWFGENIDSPPFPPEVVHWCESIAASSKSLLDERTRTSS